MTTTQSTAARRVTYQLETLWDYDYVPTHDELATLYETAKKNQWNGSTAIDWSRPVGAEGPVLNVQMAFMGTDFFPKLTPEEQKEVEIRDTDTPEAAWDALESMIDDIGIRWWHGLPKPWRAFWMREVDDTTEIPDARQSGLWHAKDAWEE